MRTDPPRSILVRVVHALFGALFVLSAAVQYNDPDPIRWFLIYTAGALVAFAALIGPPRLGYAAGAVGAVALVWSGTIVAGGLGPVTVGEIFGDMHMKTPNVELWRECLGLLIVAGYCLALAARKATALR